MGASHRKKIRHICAEYSGSLLKSRCCRLCVSARSQRLLKSSRAAGLQASPELVEGTAFKSLKICPGLAPAGSGFCSIADPGFRYAPPLAVITRPPGSLMTAFVYSNRETALIANHQLPNSLPTAAPVSDGAPPHAVLPVAKTAEETFAHGSTPPTGRCSVRRRYCLTRHSQYSRSSDQGPTYRQ